MTTTELNRLEHDPALVEEYVKRSAFGKNKMIYLPLIIGIMICFFLGFVVYDGMLPMIGYTTAAILLVVAIACFVIVSVLNRKAREKLSQETSSIPICIAKKIYGNDSGNHYYAIYTCGAKRHDAAFIEHIADKIFSIAATTKDPVERQVNGLFAIDFVKPGAFAKQLPLSFTEGEVVWRRQFSLGHLPKTTQQQIEDNNRQFWIVGLNPENGLLFRQHYQ